MDITEAKDGGLLKKILVEGKGEETPTPGSHVEVHYVGTLHEDGSKFDSSRDRDSKFKFDVGIGHVIKGWDQGIPTMKRGEKCILRARSDYGYGDSGSPPKIPGGVCRTCNVTSATLPPKRQASKPWFVLQHEGFCHRCLYQLRPPFHNERYFCSPLKRVPRWRCHAGL